MATLLYKRLGPAASIKPELMTFLSRARIIDKPSPRQRLMVPQWSLKVALFKGDSANTLGINIIAASGAPDTKIFIGNSLISSLREFSKSVLTPGNAIDSKISTYTDEITDYEDELAKLETAMETTRARYIEQFAAMESAVSSFRKTGEYLDNFMESWKAGLG